MAATDQASLTAAAEAYVAKDCFHRKFVVPASDGYDNLNVSYADVGCGAEEGAPACGPDTPVILFLPGVFATRYIAVRFHEPAKHQRVRVLVLDRQVPAAVPGMGSSTDVPIERRVSTWVEIVPKLLAHLNIPHVTVVTHCAGTVYALNTVYQCRDLLSPERPQFILLAPWVHPTYSKATLMQAGQYVPAGAFGAWNSINRFIACNIMPTLSSSEAIFGSMSRAMSRPSSETEEKSWRALNAAQFAREFDVPIPLQEAVFELAMHRMFAENTIGSNSEALHCLKKAPPGSWEKCDDYAQYVKDLADLERSRAAEGKAPTKKLRVRAFFADSDIMIGNKGRKYAESCWRGPSPGVFDDALDFDASIVPGPDHDGLVLSVDLFKSIAAYARGD